LEKIKPYIDKITADYQNGFSDGRAVIAIIKNNRCENMGI